MLHSEQILQSIYDTSEAAVVLGRGYVYRRSLFEACANLVAMHAEWRADRSGLLARWDAAARAGE